MTGYGDATLQTPSYSIHIEVKSLNSKYIECQIKLPDLYFQYEIALKNLITQHLQRGKFTLKIDIQFPQNQANTNSVLVNQLLNNHQQLQLLKQQLAINEPITLTHILQTLTYPTNSASSELKPLQWDEIQATTLQAIQQLQTMRQQEGSALEKDILLRINILQTKLNEIEPLEASRNEFIKNKLNQSLQELSKNITMDANRMQQEIIYYLDKYDITEEKIRTQAHLNQFILTMQEPTSQGRKLQFIAQELSREINTLGNKANYADIQTIIVTMKDELEKIKEQLMNIL